MFHHQPVDVISVCSADGTIKPLRLRLEGEAAQSQRVDIDEVISTVEIQHVGIEAHIFLCRAEIDDRPCLFELKYNIRAHSWCIIRKIY